MSLINHAVVTNKNIFTNSLLQDIEDSTSDILLDSTLLQQQTEKVATED